MRKAKILFLAAAAAILFAACSSDEGATGEWNGEIRLTSGLDVQSRAATNLLNKYFDKDTEIDVYISEDVESGKTATTTYGTNGKLVYTITNDEGGLSTSPTQYWPSSGNGINIYAVYPSGSDGTFTVATDQSDDDNYKGSDLMYGTPKGSNPVSRTSNAVALKFEHLLSKVTIELTQGNGKPNLAGATVELIDVLPETTLTASATEYSISKASGDKTDITVIKDESDASTTTVTSLSGSCIVPPQTLDVNFVQVTLSDGGVLYGKLNSGTPKLEAGYAYTYTISVNLTELSITASIASWGTGGSNSGEAKMLAPKSLEDAAVGDYYMSDGTLYDKDTYLTDELKAACIGIVFALASDANGYDESDYSDTGIGEKTCHGYVIALNDANNSNTCAWGEYGTKIGNYSSSLGDNNNYDDDIAKQYEWSGYKYTLAIKTAAGDGDLTSSNYPAAYYAVNYTPEAPEEAPNGTSGWFLPAAGQLKTAIEGIKDSGSAVGKSYANVSGLSIEDYTFYWSSSEFSGYPEYIALFVYGGGYVGNVGKDVDYVNCVRPVLAF